MKRLIATFVTGALLAAAFPAQAGSFYGHGDRFDRRDRNSRAQRHDHHRPNHHARRHGNHSSGLAVLGAGLLLGGVLLASEAPRAAPVIVVPPSAPPAQPLWYYCTAAGAYYPYVNACPGGWRAVPAY